MELCQASELESAINTTPDGGVCRLSEKKYQLRRRVVIRGKRNVTVEGNGAEIVTEYVNYADYTHSADAFLIEDCKGLVLRDLVLDTDVSPNVTATVEKVCLEEGSLTVRVDGQFPMRGDEVLMAVGSVDEEHSFDYRVHYYAKHPDPNIVTLIQGEILLANTYAGADCDYLGDNRFVIRFPRSKLDPKLPPTQLNRAKVGDRLCIRHTMYGPSAITLRNSDDTVLENITMHATPGMGIMVLPRCHNLTVDGLRMVVRENSTALMSCNCDGMHITGLSGKLILRNCVFDGLGDDALNIHSTAGTVTEIDTEARRLRVHYCKKTPDGELPPTWCRRGDRIRIYDPKTLKHEGTLAVEDFENGELTYSQLEGTVNTGATLQNMAFAAACEVDNCTVRNTRCRAFLFQTEQVEVKHCTFFGMSSSAIKAAPDLDYWYEVGPVDGFYIHHNRFVKNGFRDSHSADVALHTSHRGNDGGVYGLHRNVRIENNVFERPSGACIDIHAADSVCVKGNCFPDAPPKDPVNLSNCRDVTERNG